MADYRRFMVFETVQYYPSGGLGDVINSYDTLEEAILSIPLDATIDPDYDVFDRKEGVVIDVDEAQEVMRGDNGQD